MMMKRRRNDAFLNCLLLYAAIKDSKPIAEVPTVCAVLRDAYRCRRYILAVCKRMP